MIFSDQIRVSDEEHTRAKFMEAYNCAEVANGSYINCKTAGGSLGKEQFDICFKIKQIGAHEWEVTIIGTTQRT